MKKKRILQIAALVLAALAAATFADFDNDAKGIDTIRVSNYDYWTGFYEYKIDLKNKQLWEYTARTAVGPYIPRDESAENEGYTFVRDLEDGNIRAFLNSAARYGFAGWDTSYNNLNTYDGYQWGITITFSDGSEKEMSGSNAYPDAWDKMRGAFENLTGENILRFESATYP